MEGNRFNNSQEDDLNKNLEREEGDLDRNSQEVEKFLVEKGGTLTEKEKVFQERINFFVGPFKVLSDETLLKQQGLQQKKVEQNFEHDPSVEISSFVNNPDGSGTLEIGEEIKKAGLENNKVVLLLNGIVNPQDIVQAHPKLSRLFMALMRLQPGNVIRYGIDLKKILKGDSIPEYVTNTTKSIQTELFNGEPIKVIIVRNASSKNLADVIENGGEKTVLVVGGHGDFGSLCMTDTLVKTNDVSTPEKKLKAFIQHTCAMNPEQEEMGERFAQQTFGWKRGTNPVDFIENPLNPRKNF